MYQKIARIGPISFGIFFALLNLLMVIIIALVGAFALPHFPNADGIQMDALLPMVEGLKQGQGLTELAIGLGGMFIASFIVGLVMALLYNIVALITGGIKVRVSDLGYDDI